MENMLSVLSIMAGFIGLIWSADKFVLGASTTARNLGVSPLIIGLTIVAFGTSSPEIFTSIEAALKGIPELSVGNALGSNIANIGLVLAITALICPIVIPKSILKQELPVLLGVTLVVLVIFLDGILNWIDGVILLLILLAYIWRLIHNSKAQPHNLHSESEEIEEFIANISTAKALFWLLLGLIILILSSKILVFGATNIAQALGVSDLVIGLTVIAIGTSLPELAASITSALKGHHDLAIGNVIGSNIFNILLVLPIPAFMAELEIETTVLVRDYASMAFLTFLLAGAIYLFSKSNKPIGRKFGAVLLLLYLSYTGILLVTQ